MSGKSDVSDDHDGFEMLDASDFESSSENESQNSEEVKQQDAETDSKNSKQEVRVPTNKKEKEVQTEAESGDNNTKDTTVSTQTQTAERRDNDTTDTTVSTQTEAPMSVATAIKTLWVDFRKRIFVRRFFRRPLKVLFVVLVIMAFSQKSSQKAALRRTEEQLISMRREVKNLQRVAQILLDATQHSDDVSGFQYVTGVISPVRLTRDNEIQCYSVDGKNCFQTGTFQFHQKTLDTLTSGTPLTCGSMHTKVWGSTGFEDPKHWCSISREQLKQKEISGFQYIPGINTPVRLEKNGDVSCYSLNNRDCLWGKRKFSQKILDKNEGKPLTCGEAHKKVHGITGYENPKSWCSRAKKYLTKTRSVPTKKSGFKRIPKISTPIRLSDDGEVECMATLTKNGELECLWGRSSRSLTKKELDQYSGKTLKCGEEHKKVWGVFGYEGKRHWCARASVLLHKDNSSLTSKLRKRYLSGNKEANNGRKLHSSETTVPKMSEPKQTQTEKNIVSEEEKWFSEMFGEDLQSFSLKQDGTIEKDALKGLHNMYKAQQEIKKAPINKEKHGRYATTRRGPQTWKRTARQQKSTQISPNLWFSVPNYRALMRINPRKQGECISLDGLRCVSEKPQPIICGEKLKVLYKITGYDTKDHWCARGRNALVLLDFKEKLRMTSAQKDQPVWLDFEDILIRVDEDKIWRKKLAKHIDKQVDEAN